MSVDGGLEDGDISAGLRKHCLLQKICLAAVTNGWWNLLREQLTAVKNRSVPYQSGGSLS